MTTAHRLVLTSLRAWHRRVILRRGIRMLRTRPRGSARVWRDLAYGWGNEAYVGRPVYLDAIAAAVEGHEAILECGSGITTLVLAAIARQTGSTVISLEHDRAWFDTIRSTVRDLGLAADVRLTPLRNYGEFDWYDIDPFELPLISLVVCDGPPETTRGGRYGLLPILNERLAPGCTILLDDLSRPSERKALRRWQSEVGLEYEVRGGEDPYAVVTLPESPA